MGDRAEYEASTDMVTLTGKPAQVRDSDGLVEGARLTMKNKGQNVHVEAANGERTTTKHPVKNPNKK